MANASGLSISLKALTQLGIEPLALYAIYRLGLKSGYYRRVESRREQSSKQFSTLHSPFSLPPAAELLRGLGKNGQAALLKEADLIVRGRIRLFGGKPVPLQLTFDQPLRHWTEYETGKVQLPIYRAAKSQPTKPQSPDIKFLWEPARFGWAYTLGRAYHLSGRDRYAQAFWKYFEQFSGGSPPYLGPHWMNGQEVAIRLMALIWCAQVFAKAASSTPERRASLLQSLAQHAARIPPTLVYARSQNNNHLVTESAALFTAGAVLDHPAWRELGWHWLNDALQSQISSYGEYIQHSTNYHRLMLQAALWADAVLRARRSQWPSTTLEALVRASHWLFSMLDPVTGRTPNLGANDGSLILPLSSAAFDDYRPTVQAAARAFLQTGLPGGSWDELSQWLSLPAAKHTADSQAYIGDHPRARESWGYLRASQHRSRLGHMDQLHFDLWWRGLNVAQDAGTHLYNGPDPWGNPLVSTRVHNTITVDGRDQMSLGGRFLILDWSPAYSKNRLEPDDRILGSVLAYHKGYLRLGVRHERTANVFRDGHWEIRDNLVCMRPAEHNFRLHWLLPDWEWSIERGKRRPEIRLKSPRGWITLTLQTEPAFPDAPSTLSLVRAGELIYGRRNAQPVEGWASPTYGVKIPALSLVMELGSAQSFSFVTRFVFPKRARSDR